MSSQLIRIIPRTKFSFNNATSTDSLISIGPRAISSVDWVSGALSVRVFSKSFGSATAIISINVVNSFISPDDPSILFAGVSAGASFDEPMARAQVDTDTPTGNTPGSLITRPLMGAIGPMISVLLAMEQGATSGVTEVELSIDLVGRNT
jgi:hypothetical protein